MYDEYEHLARIHMYDKCMEIDITWSEVEALLGAGQVIEEHAFSDLMGQGNPPAHRLDPPITRGVHRASRP